MRILIISLFGFLAACNGTTIQQVPSNVPNESTQVAALQAQVIALQKQIDSLQIIGKVSGKSEDTDNTRALTTNFGPCSNMGVLVGFTNGTNSADPLTSDFQAFKQCTGYQYEVGVGTGIIATAERIFRSGVLVGFTNGTNSADPLTSDFQAFKQCTGYQYEVGVGTGIIATAERIF